MFVLMYMCVRAYVCMYVCMYVCVRECMYVCIYLCTCMYITGVAGVMDRKMQESFQKREGVTPYSPAGMFVWRPILVSNDAYTSVKRRLHTCQKKPILVSKEA